MQEERRRKAERDPNSKYKFFPMEEEWTWERKDEGSTKMGTTTGVNTGYGTGGRRAADHGCYGQYSEPVLSFGTEHVKEYITKTFNCVARKFWFASKTWSLLSL